MTRLRHGKRHAPIYAIWRSMRARCTNANHAAFSNYGGRGISVCERWSLFDNFYADMGDPPEGMTLDRIDNALGYSRENCRWASRREQSRNRRGRRMITALGTTRSMAEWADATGISVGTIWNRLKLGWSEHAAVTTPKLRQGKAFGAEHGVAWSDIREG